MSDESTLKALESTADQIDRLAEIIDEFLTLAEAGVPMSATTASEACPADRSKNLSQKRLNVSVLKCGLPLETFS